MNGPGERLLTRREVASLAAPPAKSGDLGQLRQLLALEQLAVAVYGLARRARHLPPGARRLMAALERAERAHLAALMRQPGVAPMAAVRGRAEIDAALAAVGIDIKLTSIHSERRWFALAHELEATLEGTYYIALASLIAPELATLAARILASEAQHSTVLYLRRNPHNVARAVAQGLVQGTPPAGG